MRNILCILNEIANLIILTLNRISLLRWARLSKARENTSFSRVDTEVSARCTKGIPLREADRRYCGEFRTLAHWTAQRLSVKLPAGCDCRGKKLPEALQPSFPDLIRFFAKAAVKWNEKKGEKEMKPNPLIGPSLLEPGDLPSNTHPSMRLRLGTITL